MTNCLSNINFRSLPLGAALVVCLGFCAYPVLADQPIGAAPPVLAPPPAIPANATTAPRLHYRVAVDQGAVDTVKYQQWNLPPEVGDGLQAQLIEKLVKSGYFTIVERQESAVDADSNEDQVDATKRASLPPGATLPPPREQRTAAAYIITPTVVGYAVTGGGNNGISLGGFSFGGAKVETTVTLNLNISDAQTSDVVDTESAIGTVKTKGQSVSANLGSLSYNAQQFEASPAGQAVDSALDVAVGKIVAFVSQQPWQALVAATDPTTHRVIINAGDLAGVAVGQVFAVYREGQPILDPDTGQVISNGDETLIGHIKVARTEQNASYCDIVDGSDFKTRDVIKAISP
jgi:curli biogenesis system outer membrane secretion channel CsgG